MSMFKTFLYGLSASLALSLSAGSVFACTQAQEETLGRAVADTVTAQLHEAAPVQSKRLIKVEDCEVIKGVMHSNFVYNYVSKDAAYAVEGTARVSDGKVEIHSLKHPEQVWASIDTNYTE